MPRHEFNPPPGWPPAPPGWQPPPGWRPDPSWPPPPPGWDYWRPAPVNAGRIVAAVAGSVAALALVAVAVLVGIRAFTPPGPPGAGPAPINTHAPQFATADEAHAYYLEQRDAVLAFVDEHPFGYDYTFVDDYVADYDADVAAQQAAPSPDPRVISSAGYSLQTLREGFADLVADWEVEYAAKPELQANATGTPAEAALDAVSLGVSDIAFDDFCGTADEALACVASGTTVHVPLELRDYTDAQLQEEAGDFWESVMVHEFAHVIQNKYWLRLINDPEYIRMFLDPPAPEDATDYDYPTEHSADCMAAAILPGYVMGYPGECTPEKLDFARSIWDGSFHSG